MSAPRRPVTVRAARWSARHPWRAVALWLVFVAACVAVGGSVGTHRIGHLDSGVGQSGQASRWIHDAHLEAPDTEDVLVTARSGRLDAAAAAQALSAATARMRTLPEVASVSRPVTSPDGSAALVQVTLVKDAKVAPLVSATAAVQRQFPALRVEQVGGRSLDDAVNAQVGDDLSAAASFSLPVTLAILLVAFGAIIAAGVPVLLALSAVGAATGLSALVSHVVPDSGTTSSMILLMGMAVGVDYSLFYVKRARAERHAGHDTHTAIDIAAETSGHSVLVSGVAVIVAMLGLWVADDPTFRSLATGSIVVVAVAVLGSLTVLPALLVLLGRHLDRPRVPVLWRWTMRTREPRLWLALLRPSLAHPRRTLVVSLGALVLLAAPLLSLRLVNDSPASLPTVIAEKHAYDRLVAAFPHEATTQVVVVKAAPADADRVATALRDLPLDPRFFDGREPVRASADGTVHVLRIDAPFDAESGPARQGVRDLRGHVVADALAPISGARWAVGGDTASNLDYDTHGSQRLPWVIAFVVALTMVIVGWVFRSVLLAVITAAVNLVSAGAAFGLLALVFQHRWAEGLLGFHSTGAVINWIPLFTFAVLSGLSMDYHVFVLGHVREAVRSGLPAREAIRVGIGRSAGTVTSAAIVMVSVFAIFASLHMVEMKEMGFTLAAAVLIDAVVVRGVVLPALLALAGERVWRRPAAAPADTRQPALVGAVG
ncbi:MAG: MMPL family transporter [Jatrophihabitans sp.]|uniref:MMPL family transporter n=1 Tax=Jatrophihabitans sp. TaxID=1932789 RepID=UPI003F80BF5C